jgi:predicted DNA-binding transcriptional regulator YafY
MNRTDRLQAIITRLQTKKVITAQEIADEFEISLRTVYRDIRALEEAGIPIGAEAGVGYFLDESYHLPPVMFTTEEASALLVAGKLMPFLADKKVNTAFNDALAKVKAVLKSTDKDHLASLDATMKVLDKAPDIPGKQNIFLQELQHALVHKLVVQMEYFSKYNQSTNKREVEPVSLLYYGFNWHLIAWCRLRNEFRDFRLDRIQHIEVLAEAYERNIEKDYKQYMEQSKASLVIHKVKLMVTHTVAFKICDSKYWYGLSEESQQADGFEMTFLNPDLEGFANWLLALGPNVNIIEPMELKDLLKKKIQAFCGKL